MDMSRIPMQDEQNYKPSNKARIDTLKKLVELNYPELARIAAGIGGLIVNSLTNLSFPWLMGQAIDKACEGGDVCVSSTFFGSLSVEYIHFLARAAGIFVLGSLASWVRVYCLGTSTDRTARKLRKLLFGGYMHKRSEYFDQKKCGSMVSVLEKDVALASVALTDVLAAGVRSLNSCLNGSVLLFGISPKLCMVTLAIVPVVGVGAMSVHRYAKACRESLRQVEVSMLSYVVERLGAISTVKVNHQEEMEEASFSQQADKVYALGSAAHFAQGSMMGVIGLATNVSLMSILFVGGNMLARKEMTAGDLTRFAIQSAFVGLGFSGLSTFYRDMTESLDGAGRVYATIAANSQQCDSELEVTKDRAEVMTADEPSGRGAETGVDAVEVRAVNFCYCSRPDRLVLGNLSLRIPVDSFTCVVGPSGVGKSTLFGLLCGLHHLPPDCKGSISVNGRDLATVDKDWLYKQISVVEQGSVGLLSGTIRENILYGIRGAQRGHTGDAEVEAAARQALAHDFISAFPDGYDTVVGECGKMLSGGQKARVLLARALLKHPSILLLDEATASLDVENEAEIVSILRSLKGKTIIAFTHSELMMELADRVLVLGAATAGADAEPEVDSVLVSRNLDQSQELTQPVDALLGGAKVVASGSYSELVRSGRLTKGGAPGSLM